jgi:hypothetical protein
MFHVIVQVYPAAAAWCCGTPRAGAGAQVVLLQLLTWRSSCTSSITDLALKLYFFNY